MAKLLKTKLWKFQKLAVKRGLAKKRFGLFLDMGTGKTLITLSILARLWRRKGLKLVLVVCPKSVVSVWRRQLSTHYAIDYNLITSEDRLGSSQVVEVVNSHVDDRITFLVLSYGYTWRWYHQLKLIPWDAIVADEVHRLKNHSSKQSQSMYRLAKDVEYRYGLTGTPMDTPIDLWAEFRFINQELFGSNFKEFAEINCRKHFFGDEQYSFKWRLKQSAEKHMINKLKPHVYHIPQRTAIPGLPPEVDLDIAFELTGKAKKAYKELEKIYHTEYQGVEVVTELAITQLLRLQQLAGGVLDDGERVAILEQNKLMTVMDFISDLPHDKKIVIFARFTPEIDLIYEAIVKSGRSAVKYDGRTKDRSVWETFQDELHPQVFVAQIATGGEGIELFRANLCIFFSKTFSYIQYQQARKRVIRPGQKYMVEFIHMIGNKTVDEDNEINIKQKGESVDRVHAYLMERKQKEKIPMAKKAKTTKKESAKKKPTPPALIKPDWGVEQLADHLGLKPSVVRAKLRASTIKKDGRTYDFKSSKGMKAAAAELSVKKEPAKKKGKKAKAAEAEAEE